MRKPISLIIGLFSYILVDLNLFKRKRSILSVTTIEHELEDKKTKSRRRLRKYKKRKYKKRRRYKEKNYKLKGTKAKDVRYANHKKIRRMFRND